MMAPGERRAALGANARACHKLLVKECKRMFSKGPAGARGMKVVVLVLLLCSTCFCQDNPELGDSFARAAIVALDGIKSFIYPPNSNAPAKVLASMKDKMDKANGEAMTAAEMKVSDGLKKLLQSKMDNNSRREMLTAQKEAQISKRKKNGPPPIPVYEEPEYISMDKKEEACFTAFEANLMDRRASVPTECDSLSAK
jgi:hypothetical protein